MKKMIFLFASIFFALPSIGQEPGSVSSSKIDLNVDVVSRYVWRGLLYNASPNIQPTLSYTKSGFSIGSWGSYGLSSQYAEVDFFASYSTGPLTFLVYDYFNEDEGDLQANDFFNYKEKITAHAVEGSIFYTGGDGFPIKLTAAMFVYGNDRNPDNGDQYYSTYFELGYPLNVADHPLDIFIGGTPQKGLYHSDAGIVNIGLSTTKELEISDRFKLPIKATLSVNPSADNVFLVIGMTF
ncbi:TorF family putative porin [Williamwhitmania taraxaci]|uniref:MetA-pathway of phenol degradation n=1 Tax=Williamwhitmania taraxaci TaxID=1640674 RepID=A0A1G6J1H3_9BACT|nr:TorF family putative porin [Williamwhitmania taraxaci]SDC12175.1 conserved hypothetical protein [Williamwhitmania taraxaci]